MRTFIFLLLSLVWLSSALAQTENPPGLPLGGGNVNSLTVGGPTGGNKGAGTLNVKGGLYSNGNMITVVCNGTDDSATLAAATAPGNYMFPSGVCATTAPIVVNQSGVTWRGAGIDTWHNPALGAHPLGGTQIRYVGATDATKTVLTVAPANAAGAHLNGITITGVSVDCNAKAGMGTDVRSVWGFEIQASGFACLTTGVHVGTNDTVTPDHTDVQFGVLDVFSDQLSTDALGLFVDGTYNSAVLGNTSMVLFRNVDIRIHNGDGIHVASADNVEWLNVRVIRGGTSPTGNGVVLMCAPLSPPASYQKEARAQTFHRISYPTFIAQGTTQCPGGTASHSNVILRIDKDNGDPDPVVDETGGASLFYQSWAATDGTWSIDNSRGLDIAIHNGASHITFSLGGLGSKFLFDPNTFRMLSNRPGYNDAKWVANNTFAGNTPTELWLNGLSGGTRVTVGTNTAARFFVDVACRRTDVGGTEAAGWEASGTVANNSDVMRMVGTPIITKWNDTAAAAWSLNVLATSPQAFQVIVTGETGKTLNCVASERMTAIP